MYKGFKLCFGQPVDPELLKVVNTEVAELRECIRYLKEDVDSEQVYCVDNVWGTWAHIKNI